MPPSPPLIGRDGLLARLRDAAPGILAVTGPPGVGKSAVVAAARGDALWVNASAVASVRDLAALLADALGGGGPDPDAVARALVSLDATDLVIDQADALDDDALRAVVTWAELAPRLRVTLTRRARPLRIPMVEVPPLRPDDAVALLRREAGIPVAEALLPDLADALDRLPHALVHAGQRLRLLPVGTLLADPALAADPDRLANLAEGSLERLGPAARRLLSTLCVFEGPMPVGALLEVVGSGGMDALQELRDASLIQTSAREARLFGSARHAARRALTGEDAARARVRHAEYVSRRMAETAPGADLRPELEAATRRLLRLGNTADAAALLAGASPHLDRWGPGGLVDLVTRCLAALPPSATLRGVLLLLRARLELAAADLDAARADADEAWTLLPRDLEPARVVAHACIRLGDREGAAAALERGLTTTQGAPELLLERGLLRRDAGDLASARADFEAARATFAAQGNRAGAAQAELRRCLVALEGEDAASTVPALHAVCTELGTLGRVHLEAVARWYLAWISLEMGDDAVARRFADLALAAWSRRGDQLGEARARGLLGVISLLEGDLDAARVAFDDAEVAREAPGRPHFTVLLLEARSILLARQGDAAGARATIARARALADGLPASLTDGLERTRVALLGARLAGPSRLRTRLLGLLAAPTVVPDGRVVEVSADGRWFRVPPGDVVDISTRAAPRRILAALLAAREQEAALDVFAIVDAGWPGESPHPEAGRARAYTAIRSLRRLGLQDVLVRTDAGYQLDPAVALSIAP